MIQIGLLPTFFYLHLQGIITILIVESRAVKKCSANHGCITYFVSLKHCLCSLPTKSKGVVALVMSFISVALMAPASNINLV